MTDFQDRWVRVGAVFVSQERSKLELTKVSLKYFKKLEMIIKELQFHKFQKPGDMSVDSVPVLKYFQLLSSKDYFWNLCLQTRD